MDDWVDPIYQEPWFQQNPGHLPANTDVYAAPEAEEVFHPAVMVAKILAFMEEWIEELVLRSGQRDIPAGLMKNTQCGPRERQYSLQAMQGQGPAAYTRVIAMLRVAHELLKEGKTASQGDIYNRLKVRPIFYNPQHVITTIDLVCSLLEVPRRALGITCASRGTVLGQLLVKVGAAGSWLDCSARVQTIPGDCTAIGAYLFQSTARFLVIVENDTMYQRLVEDGFPELAEAIIVMARGMPDLVTRAFLHHLVIALPDLHSLAVMNWTASGVHLYSFYKYGSSAGQGSQQHAVPGLQRLGVRAYMLQSMPYLTMQGPLADRDKALITALKAGPLAAEPCALEDLEILEELDVEALYEQEPGVGRFSKLLARDLRQIAAAWDAEKSL